VSRRHRSADATADTVHVLKEIEEEEKEVHRCACCR